MIPSPIPLSAAERLQGKNLYLCVRVDGESPTGAACYAYFGIFLDDYLALLRSLQRQPSMNPQDCRGIVLARSTGEPSPEIRQFMRLKFSFADEIAHEPAVLEVSRERVA